MRRNRRWLQSVTKEAAKTKIEMPWARGPRRAAFIAARTEQAQAERAHPSAPAVRRASRA